MPTIDPLFTSVRLLAHMEGSNGSTSITDVTGRTITRIGSPVISTAQAKFGGSSLHLPGGGNDYLRIADAYDLKYSDGIWTVECWVYLPGGTPSSSISIASKSPGWHLEIRGNQGWGATFNREPSADNYADSMVASNKATLGTWNHIALVSTGTQIHIFTNGAKDTYTPGGGFPDNASPTEIGKAMGSTSTYQSYIDDVRITIGEARYTTAFTVPSEAFPDTGTLPGVIAVDVSAPSPTLLAWGGGGASLTASAPTLSALGGGIGADLTLPSPTLYSTARSSAGDNDFTYTAPSPTLIAFCGASAKLSAPSASLNITVTVVNFGEAALEAPSATLSAAGKVSGTGYARLTFGNNLGAYNLVGYGGAVASITLTDSPAIQATGTTGSIGRASLSAPLFELTAEGAAHNYGSALLSAPAGQMGGTARVWLVAPGATLTAIGSAVVTATYEAYAVNLNHRNTDAAVDETTRYTNFPFTHVVRYKNSYFGVNSTGIYLLEGTTDAGTDISYAVKTATSDFDSPNQKTVASAYLSGRIGPDSTVTLHAGEGAGVPYAYTTPRGALAQNHRQVFGKGIKQHRYYSLGLSGSDALELDAIELDVKQMNRRI